MADEGTRLTTALARIVAQARTSRRVRWSGRILFLSALGLLLLFVLKTLIRAKYDSEIVPVDPIVELKWNSSRPCAGEK